MQPISERLKKIQYQLLREGIVLTDAQRVNAVRSIYDAAISATDSIDEADLPTQALGVNITWGVGGKSATFVAGVVSVVDDLTDDIIPSVGDEEPVLLNLNYDVLTGGVYNNTHGATIYPNTNTIKIVDSVLPEDVTFGFYTDNWISWQLSEALVFERGTGYFTIKINDMLGWAEGVQAITAFYATGYTDLLIDYTAPAAEVIIPTSILHNVIKTEADSIQGVRVVQSDDFEIILESGINLQDLQYSSSDNSTWEYPGVMSDVAFFTTTNPDGTITVPLMSVVGFKKYVKLSYPGLSDVIIRYGDEALPQPTGILYDAGINQDVDGYNFINQMTGSQIPVYLANQNKINIDKNINASLFEYSRYYDFEVNSGHNGFIGNHAIDLSSYVTIGETFHELDLSNITVLEPSDNQIQDKSSLYVKLLYPGLNPIVVHLVYIASPEDVYNEATASATSALGGEGVLYPYIFISHSQTVADALEMLLSNNILTERSISI